MPVKSKFSRCPAGCLDTVSRQTLPDEIFAWYKAAKRLQYGRGIFRSVSGNVCKVTSGNSRVNATRSASLRASVLAAGVQEGAGKNSREQLRETQHGIQFESSTKHAMRWNGGNAASSSYSSSSLFSTLSLSASVKVVEDIKERWLMGVKG